MTAAELIEHARTYLNCRDADIARRLDITTATLSMMKTGRSKLPDPLIVPLAELADLDPAEALAAVTASQITHDVHVQEVWKEIAERVKNTPIPTQAPDNRRDCILCKVGRRRRKAENSRFSRYRSVICETRYRSFTSERFPPMGIRSSVTGTGPSPSRN
jgi:hypothetical protein